MVSPLNIDNGFLLVLLPFFGGKRSCFPLDFLVIRRSFQLFHFDEIFVFNPRFLQAASRISTGM